MKKQLLVILTLVAFSLPLASFKSIPSNLKKPVKNVQFPTNQYKTFIVSVSEKSQTYYDTGMTTSPSHLHVYYEVYTDGTSNIVQVLNLSTFVYYTATGYNYYTTGPRSNFIVYDNGVQIDSYDGWSGA